MTKAMIKSLLAELDKEEGDKARIEESEEEKDF